MVWWLYHFLNFFFSILWRPQLTENRNQGRVTFFFFFFFSLRHNVVMTCFFFVSSTTFSIDVKGDVQKITFVKEYVIKKNKLSWPIASQKNSFGIHGCIWSWTSIFITIVLDYFANDIFFNSFILYGVPIWSNVKKVTPVWLSTQIWATRT